jgi:hypothetical protein
MGRFVKPETTILKLEDGATLTVWRRLNVGQSTERMGRMYAAGVDDPTKLTVKVLEVARATVLAYLVDWTLTDDDGAPVQIRGLGPDDLAIVLKTMTPDAFAEVRAAIDAHEARTAAARDAEKKTIPTGAIAS